MASGASPISSRKRPKWDKAVHAGKDTLYTLHLMIKNIHRELLMPEDINNRFKNMNMKEYIRISLKASHSCKNKDVKKMLESGFTKSIKQFSRIYSVSGDTDVLFDILSMADNALSVANNYLNGANHIAGFDVVKEKFRR